MSLCRHLVAVLITLSSLGCSDSDSDDTGTAPGGLEGDYQTCVDRINAFRATIGRPPYVRDASSEACADGQARSDARTDEPHGAFGDCGERAQNECPGWNSIEATLDRCLEMMWEEGPGGGHYENMASTRYSEAFCGFYTTPSGKVWAIQNFR